MNEEKLQENKKLKKKKNEANILYISTAWSCYFCRFLAAPPLKSHPFVSSSRRSPFSLATLRVNVWRYSSS